MNSLSIWIERTIDPLDLNQEIGRVSFYQTGMGYRANITLHSIRMFGLSGINLAESVVTRNENLTDIDIKLLFAFDQLMLNGSYAMKVGATNLQLSLNLSIKTKDILSFTTSSYQ